MSNKQDILDQVKQYKAADISTIISDMRILMASTTRGSWGKGATTHDTVSIQEGSDKPYKIASFHHASDAAFLDAAHAWMPMLIDEIVRLRAEKA